LAGRLTQDGWGSVLRYIPPDSKTARGDKPMLERLARWSYEHRWRMLTMWVVALVGFGVLMNVAGGPYATNFSLPGTESQATFDLLKARFPGQAGDSATIVFRARQGITDPAVRTTMESLFASVAQLPHIDSVA